MFIGRAKELKQLHEMLNSSKFEMPIIYGRRRIGKTTLIREFVNNKKCIFFTATQSRASDNLYRLTQAIQVHKKIHGELRDFHEAFELISEIAEETSGALIFVIDEYPYLAKSDESISSVLQEVIDRLYLKHSNLMLILSGSSLSFMEKQVLGYESPLFGRRTAQFKIMPMTAWEAKCFFPNMPSEDFLTIYGITSGIPLYLSLMNDRLSLKDNIMHNFFHTNTFLYEEPDNFLKQELKNPENYNSIINAIAQGCTKFNEIANKTHIASSSLDACINDLIELGIVKKAYPLGVTKKNSHVYKLVDGIFRFWFTFVPDYLSLIESNKQEIIWNSIQAKLRDFTALVFEEFCISWLKQKNGDNTFRTVFSEIGNWWGKDPFLHAPNSKEHEIDIVAFGVDNNQILLGECRWKNASVGHDVIHLLEERSHFFHRSSKELILFSKQGFSQECLRVAKEKEVHLIEFKDMIK